jgi:hypothetical protein
VGRLYVSPRDIPVIYPAWSLAYVYKQARTHNWRRITLNGGVRYLRADVEHTYWASRLPGVKSA